jgi:hypothetical protein
MRNVSLEKFRGKRDPVALDPAAMTFRAQPAKGECKGCMFDGQWAPVCKRAGELAKAAGIEDCDSGFIYVAGDPRQMDLINSEAEKVAADSTSITKTD